MLFKPLEIVDVLFAFPAVMKIKHQQALIKHSLLSIFFIFLLSACGFQLRGLSAEQSNVIASIEVSGVQAGHPIMQHINRLSAIGKEKKQSIQLVILNEQWKKNVVSVNPLGQVQEYELRYTVLYEVFNANRQRIKQSAEIRIVRSFLNDVNNPLAISREEEKLRHDIVVEFAERFLRMISAPSFAEKKMNHEIKN